MTLEADAGAVIAAVRVTVCAAPGVSVRDAGFAVTPVGRPVIATATLPVKEFIAFAVTLTGEPVAPATKVSDAGERVSEKSGGGAAIVAATVAVRAREPEVPVMVRVALPMVAVAAAVSVTVCAAPGVRLKVVGCAVTPEGRPVIATATVPLKELRGAALILICCEAPPATSATDDGEEDREKSG